MDWLVSLDDIARNTPTSGRSYDYPIRHGRMRVGVYAPRGTDPQQPHTQDELYIVIKGAGTFVNLLGARASCPHAGGTPALGGHAATHSAEKPWVRAFRPACGQDARAPRILSDRAILQGRRLIPNRQ